MRNASLDGTKDSMPMSRKGKFKVFLAFFALISLVAAWQGMRYWWFHGYATGTRRGYLRKITLKGPPYCKYIVGELVMQQGGDLAQGGETWEFSVDTRDENAPIV